ncbi:facilitated trehalose transporter Tret1-like [Aricia agestis]|uniref:facilitated trehalose transporter Tret1-like n=1 Tax=Aricia agestis TaxID=91739 RepID=UPI001C205499|nr:facilitated trehalose transporter Tret1-like [Aricia agestis]
MPSDDEDIKKGNTRMQWMLTLLVNGASLTYGFEIGWMSPTARLLQSAQSPIGGIISDSDLAWIASIINLSAILGVIIFRYITDKYGRKIGILWLAFPQLISWIMKVVYPTTTTLVISRLFGGVASGGLFLCVPIYVKEISQDDIRGSLAVLLPVVQYIGVIIMYALGAYLDYYYVVYSVIGVPVLVTLLLLRAPESPAFLVKRGKVDEAREIVAFLRGLHKNDSTVTNEVAAMEKADEVYKSLPEVSTKDIMFKDRKWRRWIYLISILFILRAMNGTLSIQTYALSVLLSTGSTYSVSPEILTFTFPIVMIITALLLTTVVERFERKRLLCFAHVVTAASMVVLAAVPLLQQANVQISGWLPLSLIIIISAMFSGGVSPLPFILLTEMFTFEIRAKVLGIVSWYAWLFIFIITFLHPILMSQVGSSNTFFVYAAFNIIAGIFTLIFLPKTRGKSEAEIKRTMGTT